MKMKMKLRLFAKGYKVIFQKTFEKVTIYTVYSIMKIRRFLKVELVVKSMYYIQQFKKKLVYHIMTIKFIYPMIIFIVIIMDIYKIKSTNK